MPQRVLRKEANGYAVLVIFLVSVTLTAVGLAVALSVNRNSERKFCDIVTAQLTAYQEDPPTTATGINLRTRYNELSRSLECPAVNRER
jgi:hypothetical protein